VGYPSAEAHLSFLETTIASLATGADTAQDTKDAAEDTSPSTLGSPVLSRDQR